MDQNVGVAGTCGACLQDERRGANAENGSGDCGGTGSRRGTRRGTGSRRGTSRGTLATSPPGGRQGVAAAAAAIAIAIASFSSSQLCVWSLELRPPADCCSPFLPSPLAGHGALRHPPACVPAHLPLWLHFHAGEQG